MYIILSVVSSSTSKLALTSLIRAVFFELRLTYFIYNFQGTPVKGDFKFNITAMSKEYNLIVNNGVEE